MPEIREGSIWIKTPGLWARQSNQIVIVVSVFSNKVKYRYTILGSALHGSSTRDRSDFIRRMTLVEE